MKKISKTINIILSVLLILVALGVAYIAFPQFGNQALIVRSGSMSPNIPVGAIVVARPANAYNVGDVLTFKSEKKSNTIITHRITSKELAGSDLIYKTKGDANEEEDSWIVKENQIIGKVNITLPYAGQFLTFVKSDMGFFAMIVIPAVFVMMLETWNIIVEVRRRRRISAVDRPFEGFGFNNTSITTGKNKWLSLKIFIPFLLILSLTIPGTYALLSDTETSVGNIFQAADDFSENQRASFQSDEVPLQTQTFSVEPTETLDINQSALEISEEPTPSPAPSTAPTAEPSPTSSPEPSITPEAEQ